MPTLEERIAARLHQALDHHERARISRFTAERGLAALRPAPNQWPGPGRRDVPLAYPGSCDSGWIGLRRLGRLGVDRRRSVRRGR
jgi:hypothetical protein